MGADDDAVAGLQRDQGFEDGGGGRVGGRDDRRYQADGFRNLLNAEGGVLFQHTAGFGVFVGVVDVFGSVVVFDDLVFHDAHAGLFDGHLRQRDTLLVGGGGGGQEDFVHLLLRVGREDFLRFSNLLHFRDQGVDTVDADDVFGGFGLFLLHTSVLQFYSKRLTRSVWLRL